MTINKCVIYQVVIYTCGRLVWPTHLHGAFAFQCNLIKTTFVLLHLVHFTIVYYLLSFCRHLDFKPLTKDIIQKGSQGMCIGKAMNLPIVN